MLCGLIFIIFLIFVMTICGIMIGISIEQNIVNKSKNGADWTQMIVGILLASATFFMGTRLGESCN